MTIEQQFYEYFKDIAYRLKPVADDLLKMNTLDEMLSKWTTGKVKPNTLILELPDYDGADLRGGFPEKIYVAAVSVVSPCNYKKSEEVERVFDEAEVILDQIMSRLIEDSAPGVTKWLRRACEEVSVIPTIPLNQQTAIGKRMQFTFRSPVDIKINKDLWL